MYHCDLLSDPSSLDARLGGVSSCLRTSIGTGTSVYDARLPTHSHNSDQGEGCQAESVVETSPDGYAPIGSIRS